MLIPTNKIHPCLLYRLLWLDGAVPGAPRAADKRLAAVVADARKRIRAYAGPELSLIVLARYSCKMGNSGSSEFQKAAQALAAEKTVSIYTRCPPVQSAGPSAGVVALIAQAVLRKDGVPSPLVEEYEITMNDAEQLISNGALDRRDYIETTIDKNQKSTTWKISASVMGSAWWR